MTKHVMTKHGITSVAYVAALATRFEARKAGLNKHAALLADLLYCACNGDADPQLEAALETTRNPKKAARICHLHGCPDVRPLSWAELHR